MSNGVENEDNIRDILGLAGILRSEDKPAEIRTLHCLGILKDAATSRYGFVHQPPKYIEISPIAPGVRYLVYGSQYRYYIF